MQTKKRLIISNASIVAVPLLVTFVAAFIFYALIAGLTDGSLEFEKVKGFFNLQYEFTASDGKLLQASPEELLNPAYQRYMSLRAEKYGAEIAVIKADEVIFNSSDISSATIKMLSSDNNNSDNSNANSSNNNSNNNSNINSENSNNNSNINSDNSNNNMFGGISETQGSRFITKSVSMLTEGNITVRLLMFIKLGSNALNPEVLLIFSLCVFIISFFAVNIWMALVLSNRIIRPLKKLKAAAAEIGSGNTDIEVKEEGDDEVRELCKAFESMRIRLKDSIEMSRKYDEGRKLLVSSISHDLKTPITSIKGYVEGIIDGVADTDEKVRKYLETIKLKTIKMDALINDLLLYSLLDMEQVAFNMTNTDIAVFFSDFASDCEMELALSGVKIEFKNELDNEVSRNVMIDREQISRVASNIIDNSKKFISRKDGVIEIILRATKASAVIEFRDNGPGIPEADLTRIFERFYRVDASRGGHGGAGLGLAIAKQIVEGHGGRIWAKNNLSINKGASIMISLPIIKKQE